MNRAAAQPPAPTLLELALSSRRLALKPEPGEVRRDFMGEDDQPETQRQPS